MVIKTRQNSPKKFHCEKCDYTCIKQSDYNKHLLTRKHQMVTNGNGMVTKNSPHHFTCGCGNVYRHKSGFCRHKRTCDFTPKTSSPSTICDEDNTDDNPSNPDLVMMLVKQNQEFKDLIVTQNNQIIELSKNTGMNNCHNTSNSHNKTFNLSFFLNETCKDAMNITDFVNSLKVSLHDLENVGQLGYAEGISRMFVKGLNDLDITRRPIHCSDAKREILHIKDQDKWEKDTTNQDKLKQAIKDLSNKSIMLMDNWRKENPGCTEYDHRKNNLYLRMMVETMGPTDESSEKRDFSKIIRAVAKNTILKKENMQR